MTTRPVASLIAAVALAALVSGCGTTATSHYYSLDATAAPAGGSAAGVSVMVGPVSVPASVDRPEMVVQVAPNRVDVDEFNRWDAPLEDAIARTVAADLSAQLGSPNITTAPTANFSADYRVVINVQRFESAPGRLALIDAVWTVRSSATGEVRSGRTVARETPSGKDYQALAAAHSRALATVSGAIANAIEAEAREKH